MIPIASTPTAITAPATAITAEFISTNILSAASADQTIDVGARNSSFQATLVMGDGVHARTRNNLKPNTDAIRNPPRSFRQEAAAAHSTINGAGLAIMSDLAALAQGGQTHRVWCEILISQAVHRATPVHGQKATGNVNFDVTGANPDDAAHPHPRRRNGGLAAIFNPATWVGQRDHDPSRERADGDAHTDIGARMALIVNRCLRAPSDAALLNCVPAVDS